MQVLKYLLTFIGALSWAQNYSFSYNFVNYNIKNGFPSSEVYYGLKDKEEFFWFATDKGVAKYNGINFENYTVDDNLASNYIVGIYEDQKNNLWFSGTNNLTQYNLNSNEFIPYQYNDLLSSMPLSSPVVFTFIDKELNAYFILEKKGYIQIDNEGKVTQINEPVFFDKKNGFYSSNKKEIKPIFWNEKPLPNSVLDILNSQNYNEEIFSNGENIVLKAQPNELNIYNYNNLFEQKYVDESKIKSVSFGQNSETLLVSTQNGLVKFFKSQNKKLRYLTRHDINYTLDGNKNGLFVQSEDNGLFIIPNNRVLSLNQNNIDYERPISTLFSNSEQLVIIREYDNNPLEYSNYEFRSKGQYLSLSELKNYNANTSKIYFTVQIPASYTFSNTPKKKTFQVLSYTYYKNAMYLLTESGVYKVENNTINKILRLESMYRQINSICFFQGELWLGTNSGCFIFSETENKLKTISSEGNYRILVLKNYNNSILLKGTQNNGLLMYKNGLTSMLNTKNSLNSNLVNAIEINQGAIWLATGGGVAKLIKNDSKNTFELVDGYNYSDGLNSTDITSIAFFNGEVYAGSKYGLNKITPYFKPKHNLNTYVKHIKINGENVALSETLNNIPNNASIEIDLMLNSYNSQSPLTYYRIKELNENFHLTKNLNLIFESVSSGSYTFEFYSEDYIEKTPIHSISLEVSTPWYAKWYVLLLFIGLLAFLIFFLAKSYSKKVQERYKTEQEINRYKLLAFNKQMSSHFISNSFNAINNFILKQDKVGGSKYLSKMSKLFRHSLLATEKNYIPFSKELEAIRSYIELEKLRFNNSFTYEITVDPEINSNRISIMPLVLQTLIENAIWHGVLPSKEKDKTIHINIQKSEYPNLLEVIIEDNGVGIELENLEKEESKGIGLVKAILQTNPYTKSVNPENIIKFVHTDSSKANKGTQCKLLIPYIISI